MKLFPFHLHAVFIFDRPSHSVTLFKLTFPRGYYYKGSITQKSSILDKQQIIMNVLLMNNEG